MRALWRYQERANTADTPPCAAWEMVRISGLPGNILPDLNHESCLSRTSWSIKSVSFPRWLDHLRCEECDAQIVFPHQFCWFWDHCVRVQVTLGLSFTVYFLFHARLFNLFIAYFSSPNTFISTKSAHSKVKCSLYFDFPFATHFATFKNRQTSYFVAKFIKIFRSFIKATSQVLFQARSITIDTLLNILTLSRWIESFLMTFLKSSFMLKSCPHPLSLSSRDGPPWV